MPWQRGCSSVARDDGPAPVGWAGRFGPADAATGFTDEHRLNSSSVLIRVICACRFDIRRHSTIPRKFNRRSGESQAGTAGPRGKENTVESLLTSLASIPWYGWVAIVAILSGVVVK